MTNSCCVKHCHNRANRERDRQYYSIPTVLVTQGKETENLTSRRRREWMAQLRLKDVTFDSITTHKFVCSDHFVNGVKAYIRDVSSPSWIPTLKLGMGDDEKVMDDSRYNRQQNRLKEKDRPIPQADEESVTLTTSDIGDSNPTAHPLAPAPDSDGFGTFCQTEGSFGTLSTEEEKMLRDELNRLTQENKQLKEHTASKEMTLESLRDKEDTVKYFTGLTDFLTLSD